MKMFTVAAGLADSVITPAQKLYCEKGVMQIDNVTIRDTHPSEWLTISQILAISSNICAAKIGLGMGESKLYEAFRRFGFGQESGLPFPGESPRHTAAALATLGASRDGLRGVRPGHRRHEHPNGDGRGRDRQRRRADGTRCSCARSRHRRARSCARVAPHVRRRVVSKEVARAVAEMLVAVTEGEGTGRGSGHRRLSRGR